MRALEVMELTGAPFAASLPDPRPMYEAVSLGVDLEEIARFTKINPAQLQAIEDESFAELPAVVYLRGFITEIAKFLKLDPTQVARTYLRRHSQWRNETNPADRA